MASLCRLLAAVTIIAASEARADVAVHVGLFLAGGDRDGVEAGELRKGAELAAEECGGACPLIAAANAGQWNAGAGELVRLVYSEGLGGVLGPVDSRSAHVAEQVVARAKGRFLLLTPWASDPALTRIKVPWFFRLVPDDRYQAEALVTEIYGARTVHTLAAVIEQSHYDSRVAAETFETVIGTRGLPALRKIVLPADAASLDSLVADVRNAGPEAVIVFAPSAAAARALRRLRAAGVTAPFFGPLQLASPTFLDPAGEAAEGMVLAAPDEACGPAAGRFRARYGTPLSAPAAYGYDGAAVLIDALRSTGSGEIEALRRALAATRRAGLTGRIEFDASGSRLGPAPLSRVERGHLRPLRADQRRPDPSTTEHVSIR